MNNTMKLLESIITDDLASQSLEQLAGQYQKIKNPSILAASFKQLYRLVFCVSSKYYNLNEEDVISYALETLDMGLQLYNKDKGKFTTFFTTLLNNRLRTETQALSTDKRSTIFKSNSYEELVENGIETKDAALLMVNPFEDRLSLKHYNLTKREIAYCDLVIKEYTNKEIAEMWGVSVMTLSNLRKNLRVKLEPLRLEFY